MSQRRRALARPLSRRARWIRFAFRASAVLAVLALAWVALDLVRARVKAVRGSALTCETNLRLIYLAQRHLPPSTRGLPPDKATAYALANDTGWTASSEEVRYLGWDARGGRHPDMSGLYGAIYCFDDPRPGEAPIVTSLTASSDIPPSSYVWRPEDAPHLLAACPYHHLAVRQDTGEIVPWNGDGE